MKHPLRLIATLAVLATTTTAVAATAFVSSQGGGNLFEFETMIGVDGPFLGSDNPVRGIPGGGLPWVLDEAEVRLTEDGLLKVEVKGLVIEKDGHPADGINPIPAFFATLSCLDLDTGDVVNLDTDTAPASTEGDAEIEEELDLPATCVAPIVFVRGDVGPEGPDAGDPWFAATGFRA